jgi:hypothetical protein
LLGGRKKKWSRETEFGAKDVRFFFRSIASTSFVAFCGWEFQMGMRFFLYAEIFLAFFTCFCTCEWLDCCLLESFMVSWLVFFWVFWKLNSIWFEKSSLFVMFSSCVKMVFFLVIYA